jgi:hypothetical protein
MKNLTAKQREILAWAKAEAKRIAKLRKAGVKFSSEDFGLSVDSLAENVGDTLQEHGIGIEIFDATFV